MFTTPFSFMAAPAGGEWTPADLPGAYIWFRADSGITTTGGLVDTWTDKINGKIASSSGTGQFTYNSSDVNFNGQPSIQWDKNYVNSAYLAANNIIFNGGDLFFWIVYLMRSPQQSEQIYASLNTSNNSTNIYFFNGGGSSGRNLYDPYPFNNGLLISPYTTNLSVPQIFMGQINNSALNYKIWDNRTTPNTGGVLNSSVPAETQRFYIGNGFGEGANQYQMDGRIAEIGYAWGAPSNGDLTNLFNYVTSRYGITLS